MHHNFLDKYSFLNSPVHNIHPLVKVVAYLILVIAILTCSIFKPMEFIFISFMMCLLIMIAKIPFTFFIRKTLLLSPVFISVLVLMPFMKGESVIWESKFILPLSLTREGISLSTGLLIKSVLFLWASILLFSTTRFNELLYVLRKSGIPRLLIILLAFMYRYVFLLIDEMERVYTGYQARIFNRQSLGDFLKTLSFLVHAIFIRSFERSGRIYQAMCARGFRGEIYLLQQPRFFPADIYELAGFIILIIGMKIITLMW